MGRKKSRKKAARRAAKKNATLRVTYPNGRSAMIPDDGRQLPRGTMIVWDVEQPNGRREMRWTVTGGGWPFDD